MSIWVGSPGSTPAENAGVAPLLVVLIAATTNLTKSAGSVIPLKETKPLILIVCVPGQLQQEGGLGIVTLKQEASNK